MGIKCAIPAAVIDDQIISVADMIPRFNDCAGLHRQYWCAVGIGNVQAIVVGGILAGNADIFGILASRIGRHEDAYTYFAQSARMDLDDYHDNFYTGIHAANMAGTWQSIVFGFAGLRLVNGVPEFKFYIPEAWNGYHFTVKIKESVLAVDVLPDGWTITLQSGDAVNFLVEAKPYKLTEKGATCHEAL